jgi:hypothetical protein
MTPIHCTECPFWVNGCSIEPIYAIGYLKSCPNLSNPVINEHGYLMNPPWDEKYILPDGHVFLFPEYSDREWKIRYTIFKSGAGSCDSVNGEVGPDMYVRAYTKAIEAVCLDRRIAVSDKVILENKFSVSREFSKRGGEKVLEPDPVVAEPIVETQKEVETVPQEIVMPEIDTSVACEQLDLF